MQIRTSSRYTIIEAREYSVQVDVAARRLRVLREAVLCFDLPMLSGLADAARREEVLTVQSVSVPALQGETVTMELNASSDLWGARRFVWTFREDCIEHQHFAPAGAKPGRCYFMSHGVSEPYNIRTAGGEHSGVLPHTTERMFLPTINHANRFYDTASQPHEMGVRTELPRNPSFHPADAENGLFAPPPLFMGFEGRAGWVGIGIGTTPGRYLFNGLVYTGVFSAGASFYVDYMGYTAFDGPFESPVCALHFAYGEFDCLQKHVDWCDQRGFATQKRFENADWHRRPVFCGWGEQVAMANASRRQPPEFATQALYEQWIATLEERKLPVGTVILDDKWMLTQGGLEVDEKKWPDMKGFVRRQHERGRKVLLWIPMCQAEGIPPELCVRVDGKSVQADAGLPAYDAHLRARIRYFMQELDVDGFKIDIITGVNVSEYARPGIEVTPGLFGIEFTHRFHFIFHDEAHRWKADAMVETQTPHPRFRDCSDILRLNDIWFGTREVSKVLRTRGRIARVAGWSLVDCDSAASTTLAEQWRFAQDQVEMGIPALYFVSRLERYDQNLTDDMWQHLAGLWRRYIEENV